MRLESALGHRHKSFETYSVPDGCPVVIGMQRHGLENYWAEKECVPSRTMWLGCTEDWQKTMDHGQDPEKKLRFNMLASIMGYNIMYAQDRDRV